MSIHKQIYFVSFLFFALSFVSFAQFDISLELIGRYNTNIFADGGSEIVAYDFLTKRLFSTNAANNTLDIIDISDPENPILVKNLNLSSYGGGINSVDTYRGLVAAAIQNDNKQLSGKVVLFDNDGNYLNQAEVGSLPDMLTFTDNGKYILVACEGEPSDDYTVDPNGIVSIIEVKANGKQLSVSNLDFTQFNGQEENLRAQGIRIFGPNASASQDLEPEYVTYSEDYKYAYVTLQENNALAIIDIKTASVIDLKPLGFKNYNLIGNGIDASDKDNKINIANWPVYGMYQPDAIGYFRIKGNEYLITANEGDARDYDAFGEEERIKDLTLDPVAFPDASYLQKNENIGRLNVTSTLGDTDNDGDFDALYSFGARSFSIWSATGELIYDSGDILEKITADAYPTDFNSTNDENGSFDNRSDNKGPEPEGLTVAKILNKYYTFIGLERIGGIMVFDITNPESPKFVQYINSRDFSGDPELGTAGDLGPEGIIYIPFYKSPNYKPLVITANEVSGSVAIFQINLSNGYSALYSSGEEMLDEEYKVKADLEETSTEKIVEAFSLEQNHPNPFNPTTTINFSIPNDDFVSLKIYDILGNEVATIVNGQLTKGMHSVTFSGNNIASGIYIYRLQSGNMIDTKRLVLLK